MGSPEIYQTIDRFVSNDMVSIMDPKSKQTNEDKIESHGFDLKTSFRNTKKKKRKNR